MKSKIIQLIDYSGYLHALCEDGTIWRRVLSHEPGSKNKWVYLSWDKDPVQDHRQPSTVGGETPVRQKGNIVTAQDWDDFMNGKIPEARFKALAKELHMNVEQSYPEQVMDQVERLVKRKHVADLWGWLNDWMKAYASAHPGDTSAVNIFDWIMQQPTSAS